VLLNSSSNPVPMMLKAGTKYRLRFINITLDESDLRVTLEADGKPAASRRESARGSRYRASMMRRYNEGRWMCPEASRVNPCLHFE
jgi:hypothetical protein